MTVNQAARKFYLSLAGAFYMVAIATIDCNLSGAWWDVTRRFWHSQFVHNFLTICSQKIYNLFKFPELPTFTSPATFSLSSLCTKTSPRFCAIFFAFSIDKRSPPWYNKVYPERGTEREAHTMTTIQTTNISTYTNAGARAEQNLIYTICGQIRAHDSVPFDKGSDYPEWHMSIKSSRFTLASGHMMKSTTFSGQIEEYFERTASKVWAYVTEQGTAYIMNETEFRTFLYTFGKFEQDSTRNGGKYKVRFPRETKAMLAWLAMRA